MQKNSKLVGIINITPDSFLDGGKYINHSSVLKHIQKLILDGASVIDIGAESTRPGANILSPSKEWIRLKPILKNLQQMDLKVEISIDTYHPETAKKAIAFGVDWINDVSGCNNPDMIDVVAKSSVKIVIMHNLGLPANTANTLLNNENPLEVIYKWAEKNIETLNKFGINKNRIIFDPGIGFGKTAEQSFAIIKKISSFKKLGVKILVGHSEKSFFKLFTDAPAGLRGTETSTVSAWLAMNEIDYIRVHNVIDNLKAVKIIRALQ